MSEKSKNILKDIGGYVAIIIFVIAIRIFIFDPIRVDGPSMDNTLCDGEIVILNKFEYRKNDIQRYDVVVIKLDDRKIIKRVIGLPNEKIEVKNNKVYADGVELDNSFTKDKNAGPDFEISKDLGLLKVPGDSYLVMGDNRDISHDSRYKDIGTIKKDQIIGKASIVIWPFNKFGTVKRKSNNKACK